MSNAVREQIMESASRLFAEKGFAGVSMAEIATFSGVEPAEVSLHFNDIAGLYGAVLESLFGLYAERMSAAFEGDHNSLEKVESFAKAFCNLHKQTPHLFTLYYRELVDPSVYFDSIVLKNIRHVAYLMDNNIAKGVQKKIFKYGVNPAVATMLLIGMFNYYFLAKDKIGASLLPNEVSDEEFINLALKVFLGGLRKEV